LFSLNKRILERALHGIDTAAKKKGSAALAAASLRSNLS